MEGRITKETDLVRLDRALVDKLKKHKVLTREGVGAFLERVAQAELGRLYPDGRIEK
jgi:hypothetical protein